MRQIVRTLRRRPVVAGLALLAIAAAGCSSSSSSGGASATATGGTASASASASSSSTGAAVTGSGVPVNFTMSDTQQASVLSAYVGGKAGQATGSPVEIGWVNSDTGLAAFPLQTTAAKAAVAYANAHLDGINGHVIKLVTCSIASEEDGQSCGSQFVNDPNMHAVIEGVLVFGSDTFFKVLNDTKAVIQISANSPTDVNPYPGNTHPNVFTLSAGAPGTYTAELIYAGKYAHVKNMLLIGEDDPAVRNSFGTFAKVLAAYQVKTKSVFIAPGSGNSTVAADLQAVGAANFGGWLISSDEPTCAAIFAYQSQAGLNPITTGQACTGAVFRPISGRDTPTNLIFPDLGWNVFLPTEHPVQEAVNKQIAIIPGDNDAFSAAIGYINVLNMVRAMNSAGTDLSTKGIATAIRGLKTPVAGNLGGYDCGAVPGFPTICGNEVGLIKSSSTGYSRLSPSSAVPALQVWQFQP
jgi:branched-chain amino acid transport system substrate-binding protein